MMEVNKFNIRVYGLLFNGNNEVLLSKEKIGSFSFTKFPGGGLEFGEGITDCLIREFKEEVAIDVTIDSHFYTTEFFQQSAFTGTDQLISIYYKVKSNSDLSKIRLDEFEIENAGRMEWQQFVWIPLTALTSEMLTFPIDKVVADLLGK